MGRVQQMPVKLAAGVEVSTADGQLRVKSGSTTQSVALPETVSVEVADGEARIHVADGAGPAIGGTLRAHLNNMVHGVTQGFEKRLNLVGVGYRAQAQGSTLNLSLGFSHPVVYEVPEGIKVETPSQTEIVVSGADRQLVGQVAAKVRGLRPPEPYKGKGVRYANERVVMKEAKKK